MLAVTSGLSSRGAVSGDAASAGRFYRRSGWQSLGRLGLRYLGVPCLERAWANPAAQRCPQQRVPAPIPEPALVRVDAMARSDLAIHAAPFTRHRFDAPWRHRSL